MLDLTISLIMFGLFPWASSPGQTETGKSIRICFHGFCLLFAGFGIGILKFVYLEISYFAYRDANLVDVSGLETESSNGKDTLVSIILRL